MSSIEDADDLALQLLQKLENWIEQALRSSGRGNKGLLDRARDIFSKTKNKIKESFGSKDKNVSDYSSSEYANTYEDGLVEGNPEKKTEYLDLVCKDQKELIWLSQQLNENNIEHCYNERFIDEPANRIVLSNGQKTSIVGPLAQAPDENGHFHLYVPDRKSLINPEGFTRLSKAPEEVIALMGYYNKDSIAFRNALGQACEEVSSSIPHKDTGITFTLNFKTVSWDEKGEIFSSNLEKLKIPFTTDISQKGLAKFSFDTSYAPEVNECVQALIQDKNSRIQPSRFENLNGLFALAASIQGHDVIQEHGPFNAEQTHLYKQMLGKMGVPFETITDQTNKQTTFLVNAGELAKHSHRFSDISSDPKSFESLSESEARIRATQRDRQKNIREVNKTNDKIVDAQRQRQSRNRITPAQDEIAAKRSAEAQKRGAPKQNRNRTRARSNK